jgi:hypothetical protein
MCDRPCNRDWSRSLLPRAAAAIFIVSFGAPSLTAAQSLNADEIHACITSETTRIVKTGEACRAGESRVTWNRQGPAGPAGEPKTEDAEDTRAPADAPDSKKGASGPAGTSKGTSDSGLPFHLPFKGGTISDAGAFHVINAGGGAGIAGSSARSWGVYGVSNGKGAGVYGQNDRKIGVLGHGLVGVHGRGEQKGVAGVSTGAGVGVYGQNEGGKAGFFKGNVTVTGSLLATKVFAKDGLIGSAAQKLFQIDHPLHPASKILNHASVESDAMKNMYDGVVTLDENGSAWVTLPDWFEALNKDFRYQLTCIGGYAPVHIAQEVENNRFLVAGGKPGLKVSWLVTGVRQDAYARVHPLQVEEVKSPTERGKYIHPTELGFPESAGIHYEASRVAAVEEDSREAGRPSRP